MSLLLRAPNTSHGNTGNTPHNSLKARSSLQFCDHMKYRGGLPFRCQQFLANSTFQNVLLFNAKNMNNRSKGKRAYKNTSQRLTAVNQEPGSSFSEIMRNNVLPSTVKRKLKYTERLLYLLTKQKTTFSQATPPTRVSTVCPPAP